MELSTSELAFRLGLALAFGMAVGIDRELRGKPAGLRTMTLVSVGAATFILLPLLAFFSGETPTRASDAARVIQGIVGGIGFLGAGVVMRSGLKVAGITTAAAVWVTAAVGVAFGMGEYRLGLIAGICVVVTLTVGTAVEKSISRYGKRNGGHTPSKPRVGASSDE